MLSQVKTCNLRIAFDADQYVEIQKYAKERGLPLAGACRMIIMQHVRLANKEAK